MPGRGLTELRFDRCEIDATLTCLLAFALTTSALWSSASAGRTLDTLGFPDVQLGMAGLRAIAGLVTRRNSPLKMLELNLTGMEPAACKIICGSLPQNPNLRHLYLVVDAVPGDTLDHVADATSLLRYLFISTSWTPGAVQSLTEQLKTNTQLQAISLFGTVSGLGGDAFIVPFENALREFNYSLREILFPLRRGLDTSRIDSYLLRNRRIQRVLGRLPPLFHQSLSLRVWPGVLEMASGLPSLTSTLLRKGDIHALSEVLQGRSSGGGGGDDDEEGPQRRERWVQVRRRRIGRRYP